MSEMIERVARAIADARCDAGRPDPGKGLDEFIARAAIEAMMSPTGAMVNAFVHKALHGDVLSHGGWPGYAKDQWQAMLQSALHGDQEG